MKPAAWAVSPRQLKSWGQLCIPPSVSCMKAGFPSSQGAARLEAALGKRIGAAIQRPGHTYTAVPPARLVTRCGLQRGPCTGRYRIPHYLFLPTCPAPALTARRRDVGRASSSKAWDSCRLELSRGCNVSGSSLNPHFLGQDAIAGEPHPASGVHISHPPLKLHQVPSDLHCCRMQQLEELQAGLRQAQAAAEAKAAAAQADNVKMYEKIKYLQSYAQKKGGAGGGAHTSIMKVDANGIALAQVRPHRIEAACRVASSAPVQTGKHCRLS